MNRIHLATAGLFLAATSGGVQAQVHSAEAVAAAILTGYQQQNVTLIAPHSNETNAGFFSALMSGDEDPAELFEGTRGAAGTGWDGMILPARYRDNDTAAVAFAIEGPDGPAPLGSGVAGRYMVIVLTLDSAEDTTWGFEDINYFDRATYAALAQTQP